MASRYDELDASLELEQQFAADLRAALEPRGCTVVHHGTNAGGRHSPGGKPDIEIRGPGASFLTLVEVTKRKGSAADGEFAAVTDHLTHAVASGGYRKYGLLYISPSTSARMSMNFRDLYNLNRERNSELGRVVALDFEAAQLMLDKLIQSDASLYPAERLVALVDKWAEATDDSRARQLVQQSLFPEDFSLALDLAEETRECDAQRERALKKQLERVENTFRSHGITGANANITLVYLAFIRLYEERRQRRFGEPSRFTLDGFRSWRKSQPATVTRVFLGRMVEFLLREIAEDQHLQDAGLLRGAHAGAPLLHEKLSDNLVESSILPIFDQYDFHTGRVDVLGAVFETLARRGEKDTRIGQFFTPQQVVDFCSDLVDLRSSDVVLDPAVGTGRFLIAAMERLLDKADEGPGHNQAEVEFSIRQQQLLGADIDNWVATIAKMNMFIHGDGKSGIETVNGLSLGGRTVFRTHPSGLDAVADVVLTNPPLGETDYTVAADTWADLPKAGRTTGDLTEFYQWLGVVPLEVIEETTLARLTAQQDEIDFTIGDLERQEPSHRPQGALPRAYKRRAGIAQAIANLKSDITGGRTHRQVCGRNMKGGALFLGAIRRYLRPNRIPDELPEWQGGRAALIMDEAVLNTAEYGPVREFMRRHFFIKAIVSLSRDAFKYLAHTDAKTSIIYLIKKPRSDIVQREPVFFSHAERVGYGATGNWIGDDLPQVLLYYQVFRDLIRQQYVARHLDSDVVIESARALSGHGSAFYASLLPSDDSARLDFFDARYRQRHLELLEKYGEVVRFSDLVKPAIRVPPEASRTGEYEFAVVTRTGVVELKGRASVSYSPRDLWRVQGGTLVLSSIDLVKGAVAVAGDDVEGLIMSKEMFAYQLQDDVDVDLHYLQLLLRSEAAKDMLLGFVTGTSNRTRIDSPEQLLSFPLPPLPSLAEQLEKASSARAAYTMQREAQQMMRTLLDEVQESWASPAPAAKTSTAVPIARARAIS